MARFRLYLFRVPPGAYPKIREAAEESDPRLADVDLSLFDPSQPSGSRVVAESNRRGEIDGLHGFLESVGCEVCITEDSSAFKAVGWGLADLGRELTHRPGWFRRKSQNSNDDESKVEDDAEHQSAEDKSQPGDRSRNIGFGPVLLFLIAAIAVLGTVYAVMSGSDDSEGPADEVAVAPPAPEPQPAEEQSPDTRRADGRLAQPEIGGSDSASSDPASPTNQGSQSDDRSPTLSYPPNEAETLPDEEPETDSSELVMLAACFLGGLVFAILVGAFLFRRVVRKLGGGAGASAGTWGIILVTASLIAVVIHLASRPDRSDPAVEGPAEAQPGQVQPAPTQPTRPSLGQPQLGANDPGSPNATSSGTQLGAETVGGELNNGSGPGIPAVTNPTTVTSALRPPATQLPCTPGSQRFPELLCHIRYRYGPPTASPEPAQPQQAPQPQQPALAGEPEGPDGAEAVDENELLAQLEEFSREPEELAQELEELAPEVAELVEQAPPPTAQPVDQTEEAPREEPLDQSEAENRPMRSAAFFLGALWGTLGVWWRWRQLELRGGDAAIGHGVEDAS